MSVDVSKFNDIPQLLDTYLNDEIGNNENEKQILSVMFIKFYDMCLKNLVLKHNEKPLKKPRSEKQLQAANKIKRIAQLWRELQESEKHIWRNKAIEYNQQTNKKTNGYNRYFSSIYKTLE